VVFADVVNEFALEVLSGSEDTAGNNIAMNLGKPNLHLVDPVGVGRGIVDPKSGVGLKKLKNFLGLSLNKSQIL
jgi:hypothetical protein